MYTNTVEIAEGVEVRLENSKIIVKGPKGESSRVFKYPGVYIEVKANQAIFSTDIKGKRGKMMVNTYISHLKNMIIGVTQGYVYKLKIVFSHFPINVKITGKDVLIENFFGEKKPRKTCLREGVEAVVEGDIITVTGINKEDTAQSAANIEEAAKRSGYDKRRFQDGIYIIEKAGRPLS